MLRGCLTVVFIFLSSCSFAAELFIPSNIKLINVNGQEQSLRLFEQDEQVNLKTGKNVLQLQYQELFEDEDNDDHSTIKSKVFVLIFEADKDNMFRLERPNFSDEEQARRFAKQPKLVLLDKDEKNVETFQQHLTDYLADLNFQKIAARMRQSSQKKQKEMLHKANKNKMEEHSANVQSPEQKMALDMLNYWWKKASPEQKQAFKQAINN